MADAFRYAATIALVEIVGTWLWNIIVIPFSLVFALFKTPPLFASILLKSTGHYLLVSIIVVLGIDQVSKSPNNSTWITGVGLVMIIMGFLSSMYETSKTLKSHYREYGYIDDDLSRVSNFEPFIYILATIFYVVALHCPLLSQNGVSDRSVQFIAWIVKIPVLGWIVATGAIIGAAAQLFMAVLYILVAVGSIGVNAAGKLRNRGDLVQESEG